MYLSFVQEEEEIRQNNALFSLLLIEAAGVEILGFVFTLDSVVQSGLMTSTVECPET